MNRWSGFNEEREYHWVVRGDRVVGHNAYVYALKKARGTRFYEGLKRADRFCDSYKCKDDFLSAIEPKHYLRRTLDPKRAEMIDEDIKRKEQEIERRNTAYEDDPTQWK